MQVNKWSLILALPLLAAMCLGAHAQTPAKGVIKTTSSPSTGGVQLTCRKAGGTPCSASDVQDMASGLPTGRRMHKPLAYVQSLKLVGPNGAISCTQTNGAACTDEQIQALTAYAAEQQKPFVIMKTRDMATPY